MIPPKWPPKESLGGGLGGNVGEWQCLYTFIACNFSPKVQDWTYLEYGGGRQVGRPRNFFTQGRIESWNLTPDQFKLTLGRLYEYEKQRHGGTGANQYVQRDQNDPSASTAAKLAKEHGVGSSFRGVKTAPQFAVRGSTSDHCDRRLGRFFAPAPYDVRESALIPACLAYLWRLGRLFPLLQRPEAICREDFAWPNRV